MAKNPPVHHIPSDLRKMDALLIQASELFGTPYYLYDRQQLERNWWTLLNNLPRRTNLHYSVKANPSIAIVHTFAQLGASFEVASMGELMAVLRAGVLPSRVIFVGPGKTESELRFAIMHEVYALVAESQREVDTIRRLSCQLGKRTRIVLRINPGVGKGMLSMGGATQFGIEPDVALKILTAFDNSGSSEIIGIHGYLGTQIHDWRVICEHAHLILHLADELQQQSGNLFTFIDIGGGFGIPYYETEHPLDMASLHASLNRLFDDYCTKYPTTNSIAAESGRFLVGSAGIFVARALDIKRYGEKCFVILDGGINVFGGHDRYAGSRLMPIRVVDGNVSRQEPLTLCGPLCTPLDRLAVDAILPMPREGSLLAFYLAGAYGYTASPGLFLSHGFPCEILADGEHLALIRERSSTGTLLYSQRIPCYNGG
jgi:diaminopimelate decarboxylase